MPRPLKTLYRSCCEICEKEFSSVCGQQDADNLAAEHEKRGAPKVHRFNIGDQVEFIPNEMRLKDIGEVVNRWFNQSHEPVYGIKHNNQSLNCNRLASEVFTRVSGEMENPISS